MNNSPNSIKAVLLVVSSMTVMAGAIIAPALTDIAHFFKDASPVFIKLILTMPALVIAIIGTFIGFLSDKFGRKNVLVISLVIYGIGGFSGYFISDLTLMLVSRAILGVGVAGLMSIATALIGDYFEGAERNAFMGSQGAFMAMGGVVFLLLGGVLADMSWRFPFGMYLMSFVVLPFVVIYLFEPQKEKEVTTRVPGEAPKNRGVATMIYAVGFLSMVFFYMIPVQIPFLLDERMDVSNALKGIAIATTTLTGAIVSLNYAKVRARFSFQQIYVILFLLMGIGFLMVGYFQQYGGILAGLAVAGLGAGLLLPNSNLWLMEVTPPAIRGRVIGGLSSLIFLGQFVSPLAVAVVIVQFDLTTAYYIGFGMMMLISGILFVVKLK